MKFVLVYGHVKKFIWTDLEMATLDLYTVPLDQQNEFATHNLCICDMQFMCLQHITYVSATYILRI